MGKLAPPPPPPPVLWEVFYVGSSALIVGGLGEAVLSAVGEEPGIVVHRLAVSHVPHSGKPQELLDMFGISAKSIVAAVKRTFANWNFEPPWTTPFLFLHS